MFRTIVTLALLGLAAPATAAPFANGLPASPDYFPIGVWLQSPRHAPEFKALGINLFVALWKGPTEDQLAELSRNGMDVVAEQNDVALASPNRSRIEAWFQDDEPDNAQRKPEGGFDPCIPAADVAAASRALKAKDPTRPVYLNFGQGVANTGWAGRGKCAGDIAYYDTAVKDADIVSFDIYPVATDNIGLHGKLEFVGRGVDNLVKRVKPGQAVWAVLETTYIRSHAMVTPEQLRDEAWMAIVHGARGIVYFVHEWKDGFQEDGVFRHPEILAAMTANNRTIATLAPVLNSASEDQRISTTTPHLYTMARVKDGSLYVFTSSNTPADLEATLALHGVGNATAEVIDENRTVAVAKGVLADHYGAYGAHIYKVPLGTR